MVLITVFWDCEGGILADAMLRQETIKFDTYIRTLTEHRKGFKRVLLHKNAIEILLQIDNARPQTSLKTQETITAFGYTVLSNPPHSPDLAPSDFHLFRALKDAIHGM
jgi:histone-lysine N-methyltransferase SETMAR